MKRRTSLAPRRALPALLAAALAVPMMVGPTAPAALAAGEQTTISWGACPAPPPGVPAAGMECGTVTVPVNYANPQGSTIKIKVSRIKAANPALRRGVLLMNPGGPGGTGLQMPREFGLGMSQSIRDRYDLIGFDPRGVGSSAPITCGLTDRLYERTHPFLISGSVDATAALAQDTANKCAANAGPTLPYITTANTARDMDRIRIALGQSKISYLGYSYGTYLGAVYASLYPTRTDRFVFDSVTSPEGVGRDQLRDWGPAFEERFPDLTTWVAANSATYGLGSTPSAVRSRYLTLAATLDLHPLPLPAGSLPPGWGDALTGNAFRSLTGTMIRVDAAFPDIAALWKAVNDGLIPSILGALQAIEPSMLGTSLSADNEAAVWLAVLCGDQEFPTNINQYKLDVLHDSLYYPLAGSMAANVWACAKWPNAPKEPKVTITNQGVRNILLVNSRRDPVTPVSHAQQMRNALGNRARMVIAEQGGHGVYLATPNTCATNYVTNFLVSGTLPSSDKTCAGYPGAPSH